MNTKSSVRIALPWLGGLLFVVAAFGAVAYQRHRLLGDVRALPPAERAALYERTVETLQSCVGDVGPTLRDYCEQQADFVRRFPECADSCRALAARVGPLPTK